MKDYNGYKNYATWAVMHHLNAEHQDWLVEQGMRTARRYRTISEWADDIELRLLVAKLADSIREYVTGNMLPELDGLASCLLAASLEQVDWQSLADLEFSDAWRTVAGDC
jgi:hypothetical protein